MTSRWLLAAWLLALSGCASNAHYPLNRPADDAPSITNEARAGIQDHDDLLLVLSFSGGGTRAAALAYGVLETLAGQQIMRDGEARNALEEVDIISSVSGGSFVAAYYGLYSKRLFSDFEHRFLKRDIEADLTNELLKTENLSRITSAYFGRSDVLAEYYDRALFDGASMQQLFNNGKPRILINATRMTRGTQFAFTPNQLAALNTRPDSISVGRAVAASSAVPVLFTPIVLRDYQYTDCLTLAWPEDMDAELIARETGGCYMHLIDGGVNDNLGLGLLLDGAKADPDPRNVMRQAGYPATRRILIILTDASTPIDKRWERTGRVPPTEAVFKATLDIPVVNANQRTLARLDAIKQTWAQHGIEIEVININTDLLKDPERRAHLRALPTALTLPAEDVDALRAAARELLLAHPLFQKLKGTK
ncbi:MAG: patatin-like phospholipase family protein [Pseudomonadota bacterium]